jgi:hypothetical protein
VKPSWKVPALQRFVVVFEPGHAVAGTRTMPFRHTQMWWIGPPIRPNRPKGSVAPGFTGADSMPATATDLIRTVPSIVPGGVPALSDDECLLRLAQAVEAHDTEHLDEVARLIARLAVTIE